MARSNHLVLTEFKVAAGEEWQTNSDVWLLLRISSGIGYWRDSQGGYREISPEDVLLVFPGASGTFLASRVSDLQIQAIDIDLGLLCGVLTVPECRALSTYAAANQQKAMFLPRVHPFSVRFSEISRNQRGNALLSRLKLLQLFAELINDELEQATAAEPVLSDSRARMINLIQQIPEAVLMKCSVTELAEKLFCSQRHFSRLFREEFGVSLREKQTKLRLERARHLLENSPDKIIDIALDAGYQSLSLFNVMFKERFKMTPSQWRARVQSNKVARRRPGAGRPLSTNLVVFLVCLLVGLLDSDSRAASLPQTSASSIPAKDSTVPTNSGPRFAVTQYQVLGNTLISPDLIEKGLRTHTGPSVSLPVIKQAVADLVLMYRERGYATVGVSLPQQQITNGIVRIRVNEGKLAEILVINNRHFSSNNVLRALPGLSKGMILNSKFFQAELDHANANRDRQIYPQLQPGPEPGTSSLLLKVKDRLPLHGRVEWNNQKTPNTPDMRLNTALQYNNLWQLEHSVGFQYGFTPESFKAESPGRSGWAMDRPLISFYNAFYRMPLGAPKPLEEVAASRPASFGYNEATRQFSVPPPALVPELYLFANRSTTDSEFSRSPTRMVSSNAVNIIRSWEENRDFSTTESVGFRINWPLLQSRVRAAVSFGLDVRHYESLGFHTNTFSTVSIIPPANPNDPPETNTSLTISGRGGRPTTLTYVPVVFRGDLAVPDKVGVTSFSAGTTYNLPIEGISDGARFTALTGSPESSAGFVVVSGSLVREQSLGGDWRVFARAEGQTSSEPLFSNEQFALGGVSSVRGYLQGESFGDSGFRLSLEPRTPAFKVLRIGNSPVLARFNAFLDYGRTYLSDPRGRDANATLSGAGSGMNITVGKTFDIGAVVAWPLTRSRYTENDGTPRAYLSISAQF